MFASTTKMFSSSASKPSSKQSSKQSSKHSSTTPLIPADLEDMYDEDDGLPEVIYVIPMRITGFLLLAFGIAELVIGLKIYDVLTNVTLGSWWCVPVVIICAALALISNSKSVVIAGIIFSLVGCIFTLIASIVDGGAAHTFYNYKACFSPATGTVYGDKSYTDFLMKTCDSGSSADEQLCYCASDDDDLCWEYDLSSSKHTCNILLTLYPDWLVLSFSFCTVCLFLCLVYLSLTVVSAFCLKWCVKRKVATEEQ